MALIQSTPHAEPELAEKTGDYFNASTGHRAWFQQGDPISPGYVLDDTPDINEDIDDAALRKAVAAETRDLEKKAKEAAERAEKAEEQRKESQGLVERLEQEKRDETAELRDRVAELEAQLEGKAPAGDGGDGKTSASSGGGTPRAQRRDRQA